METHIHIGDPCSDPRAIDVIKPVEITPSQLRYKCICVEEPSVKDLMQTVESGTKRQGTHTEDSSSSSETLLAGPKPPPTSLVMNPKIIKGDMRKSAKENDSSANESPSVDAYIRDKVMPLLMDGFGSVLRLTPSEPVRYLEEFYKKD